MTDQRISGEIAAIFTACCVCGAVATWPTANGRGNGRMFAYFVALALLSMPIATLLMRR